LSAWAFSEFEGLFGAFLDAGAALIAHHGVAFIRRKEEFIAYGYARSQSFAETAAVAIAFSYPHLPVLFVYGPFGAGRYAGALLALITKFLA
jgi:hypothetical protein